MATLTATDDIKAEAGNVHDPTPTTSCKSGNSLIFSFEEIHSKWFIVDAILRFTWSDRTNLSHISRADGVGAIVHICISLLPPFCSKKPRSERHPAHFPNLYSRPRTRAFSTEAALGDGRLQGAFNSQIFRLFRSPKKLNPIHSQYPDPCQRVYAEKWVYPIQD